MPRGLNRILMAGVVTAVFVAIIFRVAAVRKVVTGS